MAETAPLISVIVPVYKVEDYLDECVESILAQTEKNFELILVDDGSPDGCPALCDAWAERDGRVRVLHKPNGGVSSARNVGIDAARGEYLAFIDGDDVASPRMLSVLREGLEQNGAEIARATGVQKFEHIEELRFPNENLPWVTVSGPESALHSLTKDLSHVPNDVLLRRSAFSQLRFDTTIHFGEDLELLPRLYLRAGRVAETRTLLYGYRQRAGSAVAESKFVQTTDLVRACQSLLREIQASDAPQAVKRTSAAGALYVVSFYRHEVLLRGVKEGDRAFMRESGRLLRRQSGTILSSDVSFKWKRYMLWVAWAWFLRIDLLSDWIRSVL